MEKRPSSKDTSHSASHDIPRALWDPNVHCRIHNSTPLVTFVGQLHRVHDLPAYFPKIQSNIIFLSTFRSSKWSLSGFL